MANEIYGLIGRTLKHSYSVEIHRELGNPGYRLIELEPEALPGFFSSRDIGGLNVTIPYKRNVMDFCASLSAEAAAIGSVNTIVTKKDGLYGHNTDAYGLKFLCRRAKLDFSGRKVVVFGSGGASLTVQSVARELGASKVVVVSRRGPDNYENLDRHRDAQILINATPVGMFPRAGESVADISLFERCEGIVDLIYNPRRTAFLMQAEKLRIPCSDGLPMLVAQAKAAEELFFNTEISDSEIERILTKLRGETGNIVLVGMPGSGKTAVGEALAKLTGRGLIDMDEAIERAEGMSVGEIFKTRGEEEFRLLERRFTAEAGALGGKIIATGGGAVKDERNYAPLHSNGRIYHIVRDINLLPREGRPLSLGADLAEMYAQRLPMYERFRDASVQNDGSPEETAEWIWRDYLENTGD